MDPNTLRLRLDRVEVRSAGASVATVQMPLSDLGVASGDNILSNAVNGQLNSRLTSEINKYVAFQLSFGHSRTFGKKLLVEFLLNPNDPEQMANLVKFMNGDYSILKRLIDMGLRFNQFSEKDEADSGAGKISGVATQAGGALGSSANFSGSDIYDGHSNSVHVQVPVLHTQDISWSSAYNRYQSTAKDGETIHVQQRTRVSNGSSLNIPFVGTVSKYNSQKNAYVINKESTDGKATRPVFLYQQYEGFVKEDDGTARDMIRQANGVLKYVGTAGNGTSAANTLQENDLFPPLPLEQAPTAGSEGAPPIRPSKIYKDAVMSFKLMINDNGVQNIIFAPAQAIMKAYMNVMREANASIVDRIIDLFTIDKKGGVAYDAGAVEKRLGMGPGYMTP
jgi:hypothetical protein